MDNRYIIAFELSGSQVKGAVATLNNSPQMAQMVNPVVEVIATEDNVNCVQYGRVQNIIEAVRDVDYVVKKLENNPKLKNGKIVAAYVGLSGRSLGSVPTTAELSLPHEMEITPEIVKQLEAEASKLLPDDRHPLKVVPRKFYVDNQVNQNPVGSLGTRFKGEFTIVVCNKLNQRNLDMVIADRSNIAIRQCVITPLAVADLVLSQEDKQLGCVLVDLGAQTTTVSIYKDRSLQYLATLPIGSNNITIDIAKGLNITEERAETAKIQQGDATINTLDRELNTEESSIINCYVQARLGEIIANINAQIGYAGYKAADLPAGLVITGRGAKLKNLKEAMAKQMKIKARLATLPNTVSVSDYSVNANDYVSLISIVSQAARSVDVGGCVKMQQPAPVVQAATSTIGSSYNPITGDNDTDDNDNDWMMDQEDIDKQNGRKAAKKSEKKGKKQSKFGILQALRRGITNITAGAEDDDADMDE